MAHATQDLQSEGRDAPAAGRTTGVSFQKKRCGNGVDKLWKKARKWSGVNGGRWRSHAVRVIHGGVD